MLSDRDDFLKDDGDRRDAFLRRKTRQSELAQQFHVSDRWRSIWLAGVEGEVRLKTHREPVEQPILIIAARSQAVLAIRNDVEEIGLGVGMALGQRFSIGCEHRSRP